MHLTQDLSLSELLPVNRVYVTVIMLELRADSNP